MTMLSTYYTVQMTLSTAKCLLHCAPAANLPIKIHQVIVSFQGTSNTATPPLVTWNRFSNNGGGGTAIDDQNIPIDDRISPSASATWLGGVFTTEPAEISNKIFFGQYVHSQSWQLFPSDMRAPIVIAGGNFAGIQITTAADIQTAVTAWYTEER